MTILRIPYWLSDNGDGSASLCLCTSFEDAQREEQKSIDSDGNFAEETVDEIELKLENGKLYISVYNYKKHVSEWKEIKNGVSEAD